jgi:hypothetical protein
LWEAFLHEASPNQVVESIVGLGVLENPGLDFMMEICKKTERKLIENIVSGRLASQNNLISVNRKVIK